ncbi:MAG: hypothetical protein QNK04_33585 [Myxococcota bacterium]|nr:hypothetical protein [Myxococcota bacterium]
MRISQLAALLSLLLAAALPLAALAGPNADPSDDLDGDGVRDGIDNCLLVANADQDDIDHDGCGDPCDRPTIDCDLTGDAQVGGPDYLRFVNLIPVEGFPCTEGCTADCTGDGIASGPDFVQLSREFGNALGPSCSESPLRDLVECPFPANTDICFPPPEEEVQ